MHGKTTFILTDKTTGKIVEKREEHNLVTNALRDIMNIPSAGFLNGNMTNTLNSFLPLYNTLLHGIVLFGENIPEREDDYLMGGRYNIVGTAGAAYTGTDSKRGSFNTSQSGVIENGYRFVWDFAPEKAVGTIKCVSLSSLQSGNQGGTFSAGSTIANVYDAGSSDYNRVYALISPMSAIYAMNYGSGSHYYYNYSSLSAAITLYKYRVFNPGSIGICSTTSTYIESTRTITLPFEISSTFANVYDGKIYFFNTIYESYDQMYMKVNVGEIDVETGACRTITNGDVEIAVPGSNANVSGCVFAVFNNRLYVVSNEKKLYVHDFNGNLIKEIPLKISSFNSFFLKDGKLWAICRYSETNSPCYMVLDSEPIYLPNIQSFEYESIHENENIKSPYVVTCSNNDLYIMFRTDYMATINNLSEPLEKTDEHALQIRYEITDE